MCKFTTPNSKTHTFWVFRKKLPLSPCRGLYVFVVQWPFISSGSVVNRDFRQEDFGWLSHQVMEIIWAGGQFQSWLLFSISYVGCHPNPIDELHHFSRWLLHHQPAGISQDICCLVGVKRFPRMLIYFWIYKW